MKLALDRLKKHEGSLMRRGGEKDPAALAAYIGRKRSPPKKK